MTQKIVSPDRIAGVVFAGGRSRRFEGGEKENAVFGDRPLIDHVIERAAPQVRTLAIGRARGARGNLRGAEIIADEFENCGPIAGLSAGLKWAGALTPPVEFLATFACDTPRFPVDIVRRLSEPVAAGRARAAIAATGGALHPTFGLWAVSFVDEIDAAIGRGEFSLKGLAKAVGAANVDFGAALQGAFFNINRREDLELLERSGDKNN
ncbi:MAG: NTP transferase domain-containing protein [Parvularculaceae bacterium]|nr:NTP transferase domain-containing protein [Parvularculaceae bacterium]